MAHSVLVKPIEEKSVAKYRDLPQNLKKVFGTGFTNEMWQSLYDENKLSEVLQRRNNSHSEYGVEHPIERLVPYKEIVQAEDEIRQQLTIVNESSTSEEDDSSNEQLEEFPKKNKPSKHVTFADDTTDVQVHERPKRNIKPPNRLNL